LQKVAIYACFYLQKVVTLPHNHLQKVETMLKRKILQRLEDWHKLGRRKAPIITGARQVGKTTAVREYAKRNYENLIEINFVKQSSACNAFDGDLDANTIITNLSAMGYGPFVPNKTLIFFDEIQECPNARTAIKFLVEDGRFDYIESGSLLGINYKPIKSYPVGFEEEIKMFPMDFEEFLWAKGIADNVIDVLRNSYEQHKAVPEFIHNQISRYYREYLVVGGMPEVVQTFITNPDFNETVAIQQSILTTYRADISRYAGKQQTLVKRIFDAIPAQLGKQDKRFILANVEKGATLRKYEDPTQWLVDAGLVYYSFNTNAFELPFEATENLRLYKLYMVDTGLLSSFLLKRMQFDVLNGDLSVNEGAITENFIACVLASKDINLHYYDKKSRNELDFIFAENRGISIIEVKSGEQYKRHASLDYALSNYDSQINRAIVFSKFNVEQTEDILYLPLYMAMFI
jgi:predicted AAA+ superfamily ATPase